MPPTCRRISRPCLKAISVGMPRMPKRLGDRRLLVGVHLRKADLMLEAARRFFEVRRHRAARTAPRCPEVDDHRQIAARDVLVEARRFQFQRMILEQRVVTLRAARPFAEAFGRHAHDGIAMAAHQVNGVACGRLICAHQRELIVSCARSAGVTRQMRLPTSSATSNPPRPSTATPTGRPSALPLLVEEAGQDLFGLVAAGPPAGERDEDHAVAGRRLAIPRAVLADERAAAIALRQQVAAIEHEPERCRVRAERVVGHDRLLDQVGPRRLAGARRRDGRSSCTASRRSRRPSPKSCSRARDRCRVRRAR